MATSLPLTTTPTSARSEVRKLPTPSVGRREAERFVVKHLAAVAERRGRSATAISSSLFRGGQRAADTALARFDVDSYRSGRQLVYPQSRRTWSMLSPWIRHGMLSLRRVWDRVEGGANDQVSDFRRVLLRQEHARHLYGAYGGNRSSRTSHPTAATTPDTTNSVFVGSANVEGLAAANSAGTATVDPIDETEMGCLELIVGELMDDGWLPDDARRWLADYWIARRGLPPDSGRRWFASHLLDGSGASNLLNWQAATGSATAAGIGMSRWEIEAQAPGLCASCSRVFDCPIDRYRLPLAAVGQASGATPQSALYSGTGVSPEWVAGPRTPDVGPSGADQEPEAVWITAESMGDSDPALVAHPDLPAVFVFDEPLLKQLRLSTKRLVFLTETLADLASRRELEVWFGDPVTTLEGRRLAVTFTPTPGWRRRSSQLDISVTHPWPWLVRPDDVKMASSLLASSVDVRKERSQV